MDSLRTPFFILAVVLMAIVVSVEIGSSFLLGDIIPQPNAVVGNMDGDVLKAYLEQKDDFDKFANTQDRPPGLGIPYMAALDLVVLFTVGLMGMSLLVPEAVQGRVQGCATFIFALLLILGGIVLIFAALFLVILMVSLLLAVPFGTLTYLAIYGFFDRGSASVILSLLMFLKLGFVACLLLAQQRFVQNKGLVLIILLSLLGNVIISFLHGFVPGFLVSITDGIAAIIVMLIAVILAVLLLIGSIPAIGKALRPRA
ncbi:MAG: hypothetical protein HY326_10360 [Chloroflexi bacterium]|nr:hypothetical protein [Chloroflexota bacterium]